MSSYLNNVKITSSNSSITYFYWFLLLTLFACSANAQPASRIYYALLGEDGSLSRISPYYKFYPIDRTIPSTDEDEAALNKRSPMKKYDRNCFFSPVQCMLSYDKNADEALYRGRK